MDPNEELAAGWKDAAAYAPLLAADRSIFAWEWLRRDPGYRAAALAALEGATANGEAPRPEHWGLHAFEYPELAAPSARPVWRADIIPCTSGAGRGVRRAAGHARSGAPGSDRHDRHGPSGARASASFRWASAIRIDVLTGTLLEGPVRLRYLIAGLASAEAPLLTLRRLLALGRTGRFSRSLHPRETRARRWVLALRASDALDAGADQREMASVLLSRTAGEPRWRSNASSVRSQVQRLVRGARRMAAGGYLDLLR